jgi:hypothetical protein
MGKGDGQRSSEFWVLSLGMIGEAELGMMNGECGIVGEVMKTSNLGLRTLFFPVFPASLIRLFGLSCLFG